MPPKTNGRFALLSPVRPWLMYAGFLSLFINVLTLASPIYMLQIFDRVLVSHSLHTLGMLTIITVILVAAFAVLDTVRGRLLLRAGVAMEQSLGPRVLDRLLQFDLHGGQVGIRAEVMRDVSTLRNYLSSQHMAALFDSPWVIVFTLLIFGFSWLLGVITLIGMLILFMLAYADEKFTHRHYTEAQSASQRTAQFAHASIRNNEILHALGMKNTMLQLWRGLASGALDGLKKASNRGSIISGATKAVRIILQIAMLGAGAYLVVADNLPPGIMIAATIIVARAIGPVESVISGWRVFIEARNAYANIEALLQQAGPEAHQGVALPALSGAVTLESVYFSFGPGAPILSNVSLKLEPGEALGLIGPSGSGKSTLARAILGLIRPAQGKVMLDGYDINHYERSVLGAQLGYLPQAVELMAGTVAQNICRMQDADAHSDEIVRVGEWLQLRPVIAHFPKGYDTMLADGGTNLSGGQRQAIGLARAFFGSPRLVILDEPDGNLDEQGEAQLLSLISEIRAKRLATLIVVTHNPRIRDCMDRLLVLKNGTATVLARSPESAPLSSTPVVVRSV